MVEAISPIIGSDDTELMAEDSGDVRITLKQDPPLQLQATVLDKEYAVTIETTGGMWFPYCVLESDSIGVNDKGIVHLPIHTYSAQYIYRTIFGTMWLHYWVKGYFLTCFVTHWKTIMSCDLGLNQKHSCLLPFLHKAWTLEQGYLLDSWVKMMWHDPTESTHHILVIHI